MDTIAFTDVHDGKTGVRILINGRELMEMVREVETPLVARDGRGTPGGYRYFPAYWIFNRGRLCLLGEPDPDAKDSDGRIYILGCPCGYVECRGLQVRIIIGEKSIVWRDFCDPHRKQGSPLGFWDYSALGPFEFDRASYEQALSPPNRLRTLSLFLEGDYRFLWCEGFDVDPVLLPIPDKLKKELTDFHQWFQELYGSNQKPPDEMESRLFDEQGLKLWRELQPYLKDEYHVVYFSREFDDYFATPDSLEAMWKTVVMG